MKRYNVDLLTRYEASDGEYVRWKDHSARVSSLEQALWDVIDLSGRYPHPNEPEKLTSARNLLLEQ
jgi:hypothetical protein